MNFNLVYSKMHNYIQVKDFEAPEFNLQTHPKNKIILPLNYAIPKNDSSKRSGFLKTKHGPVMFASHMIRKTNNTGEQVGAMVFIRKLRLRVCAVVARATRRLFVLPSSTGGRRVFGTTI